MSTRQFAPVNPGLWEGLDALFGTTLSQEAHKLNISFNPKFDLDRVKVLEEAKREPIGTKDFKTDSFVSDVNDIAGAFGASQDLLDNLIGADEDERFQKALDLMDFILSGVKMIPLDKMEEAKEAIRRIATGVSKYAPDSKTIGKFLAMIPGMNKYAKNLIGFAEGIESTISTININADDCLNKAVDQLREAFKSLRGIKIKEVNDNAKKNDSSSKVIDMEEVKEEKKEEKKEKKEKKKDEKPSDVITGTSEPTVVGAVAFSQQMMQNMQPGYIPDQDGGLPSWMGTDVSKDPNRAVPEFIAQNDMRTAQVDPRQIIFSPVQQSQNYSDQRIMQYPFISAVQDAANKVGMYATFELIVDSANNPLLIFVRTYNSQAYNPDKSFIIDLGVVIDGRIGIWPCAEINQQYRPLETCDEAYRMYPSDSDLTKVNAAFLTEIFQYGFSNINPEVKKKNILYGDKMTNANRVFALITIPTDINKELRSIIRGFFIRSAPDFMKKNYNYYGRFHVVSVDQKTREVVISNEGMSQYFMGPVYPHTPLVINLVPEKDADGNFVPAGKKGGTDIKYNVVVNDLSKHPYIIQDQKA